MDLIAIIFAIIAFIASQAAKKKKSAETARGFGQTVQPPAGQAAARKAPPPSVPIRPNRPLQHAAPAQSPVMSTISFSDVPGQAIMPTVHAHVQPDCETHDAPGSLGVVSSEGKDPCHEDQLTDLRSSLESPAEEGGLTLTWSGENMVKAFIMQEVLARPCQRHGR